MGEMARKMEALKQKIEARKRELEARNQEIDAQERKVEAVNRAVDAVQREKLETGRGESMRVRTDPTGASPDPEEAYDNRHPKSGAILRSDPPTTTAKGALTSGSGLIR